MSPTAATELAAVIGSPVRHSLSPVIHNAAFAALGLDWIYLAFDVPDGHGADALSAMRTLGIRGLSVTMPHKHAVIAACDELTAAAGALDAVNCVHRRDDGNLLGLNTDGDGFVAALACDHSISVAGMRCVVVGAGGAGRAVVEALARHGATDVVVVNRSPERAAAAAALAGPAGHVVDPARVEPALARADLLVNATSVGMGTVDLAFDPAVARPGAVVADLVYHPVDTALLRAARRHGLVAVDGVGMLVHQAARQLEVWTGCAAPLGVMRAAVDAELARRRQP